MLRKDDARVFSNSIFFDGGATSKAQKGGAV
jgi:hypothetical protein